MKTKEKKILIDDEILDKIKYALTLVDRRPKKHKWINRGFNIINFNNKNKLFCYWKQRLQKNNLVDRLIYKSVLHEFYITNKEILKKHKEKNNSQNLLEVNDSIKPHFPILNNLDDTDNTYKDFDTPSISKMAKSALSAVKKFGLSGFKKTSEKEINKRLEICKKCDFWDDKALNSTGRCNICGCSTWAKIRMATEKCPHGKWVEEHEITKKD